MFQHFLLVTSSPLSLLISLFPHVLHPYLFVSSLTLSPCFYSPRSHIFLSPFPPNFHSLLTPLPLFPRLICPQGSSVRRNLIRVKTGTWNSFPFVVLLWRTAEMWNTSLSVVLFWRIFRSSTSMCLWCPSTLTVPSQPPWSSATSAREAAPSCTWTGVHRCVCICVSH